MSVVSAKATPTRRERWAWYLYDFGNSAYAAVVLLAVYSVYFQGQVVGTAEGSRLWGLSVAIAMLVVAVTAPVLGAIADFSGSKKPFLLFFTTIACLFTATLFFVRRGDVLLGMSFFILAEIGYRSAQVFYDALLPEIATPAEMATVSGKGWAVGSAGGIVCLLLVLPMIMFIKGDVVVRLTMVVTEVFFALSTIPLVLWLRERAPGRKLPPGETFFTIAFGRLWHTVRLARNFREFVKFMVAYLIYNDGVIMALDFAAIMGAVLYGLSQQMLIVFVIVVQLANVGGAYVFGVVAERVGCKRALVAAIALMLAAVVWLFTGTSATEFFAIGLVAGFAMAGIQSVSRTLVGIISPPGRSAEFYGFFAVAGRTSSFIGPAVYGWLAAEATLWYQAHGQAVELAERSGQRLAILSIAVFMIVGLAFLLGVNEKKARAAVEVTGVEAQ
jgi:UMF1 family MFS transporter